MAFVDQFKDGGNYKESIRLIEERRIAAIKKISSLKPENLKAQLQATEDAIVNHELHWVKVSDPRGVDGELEVLPVISYWKDDNIGEEYTTTLTLFGKLSSGERLAIGRMNVDYGIPPSFPPTPLAMDIEDIDGMSVDGTPWDSADAEIFLKLAESAFEGLGL